MQVLAFILLVCFLHLSARGFSQITIVGRDIPLKKVFRQIEKQTGYDFLCSYQLLNEAGNVDISLHNGTLDQALAACLKGKLLTYSITDRTVVILPKAVAADSSTAALLPPPVHGRVTDAAGLPLEEATVTVKGTRHAVKTNANGEFSVEAPEGTVLVVTYLGYGRKEIKVSSGGAVLDIQLSVSPTELNQVVLIGYGSVKRADLTGAISTVRSADITPAPVGSVDQALQGKAAGMLVTSVNGSPGAATSIRIRGGNSITASNEPLYVVDGYIGGGSLSSINTADIESVEVLKDASATAIYGARGANGVVLITTKRGKPGEPGITINGYTGTQKLPKEIGLLTGPQLAVYVNEITALNGTAPIYPDVSKVTNTDWQKAVTRSASLQNSNIAFSGGSDKMTYYVSGDYFNQDGIILNSGFRRYQTRVKLDFKLTDWLTIGTNINYSRNNTNNSKVNLYDILKSGPTSQPVKDSAGNYTITSNLSNQTFENPVATALEDINNTSDNSLLGIWYAQMTFKNGLQFKSVLDVDDDNNKAVTYTPGSLPLRSTQKVGGAASIANATVFNLENENTISWTRDFRRSHLDVLGGFTYQKEVDQGFTASASGFTNDALTYNNLATGDPTLAKNTSTDTRWTIISLLGRANYSYQNKYLFTASVRDDGSSRLSANNKHAFFPSGAFAWKIGEEEFMKNAVWISNLKLRVSYGKTGNQAVAVYSTLPSLTVYNSWFNSQQNLGYILGNIPNDNLKWETTDQYNIGVDAGFLNHRINTTLDFYYKKTYNLLLNVKVPGTTGYSTRLANVGKTQNKGVELSMDARIVDNHNFTWDVSVNIAANRNTVVALGPGQTYIDIADGYRLIVGRPAPVFFGAIAQGTYHTQDDINKLPAGYQAGLKPGFIKLKDVNGNGKYDGALTDGAVIGNPQPKFFGGFSSSLRYHRFSMSMYFEYSYGNDVVSTFGPRLYAGDYASNISNQAVNRWEPDNTSSNFPRAGAYTGVNVNSIAYSFAVQNGSFLRLKTIQLNYDLRSPKVKWLKGANIYITGSNVFNLNHYTWGYDPEVSSNSGNPVEMGTDSYAYPANRSFLVGVNLKF